MLFSFSVLASSQILFFNPNFVKKSFSHFNTKLHRILTIIHIKLEQITFVSLITILRSSFTLALTTFHTSRTQTESFYVSFLNFLIESIEIPIYTHFLHKNNHVRCNLIWTWVSQVFKWKREWKSWNGFCSCLIILKHTVLPQPFLVHSSIAVIGTTFSCSFFHRRHRNRCRDRNGLHRCSSVTKLQYLRRRVPVRYYSNLHWRLQYLNITTTKKK